MVWDLPWTLKGGVRRIPGGQTLPAAVAQLSMQPSIAASRLRPRLVVTAGSGGALRAFWLSGCYMSDGRVR